MNLLNIQYFNEIPIEYFNEDTSMEIKQQVSKSLTSDQNTSMMIRGKFSLVCVEVNLTQPLISKVKVGKLVQVTEYEVIHIVHFDCDVFDHRMEKCPLEQAVASTTTVTKANSSAFMKVMVAMFHLNITVHECQYSVHNLMRFGFKIEKAFS